MGWLNGESGMNGIKWERNGMIELGWNGDEMRWKEEEWNKMGKNEWNGNAWVKWGWMDEMGWLDGDEMRTNGMIWGRMKWNGDEKWTI